MVTPNSEPEKYIIEARKNLENLNNEIINAGNKKLHFSIPFLLVGAFLAWMAMNRHDFTPQNTPSSIENALIEVRASIQTSETEKTKTLEEKKEYFSGIELECKNKTRRLYMNNNPHRMAITGDKRKIPEEAYYRFLQEKTKQEIICNAKNKLNSEINIIKNRLDVYTDRLIKINTEISSLRKNKTSAYMLFFCAVFSFLASIFTYFSFLKSRQKSVSIRLKIDQCNRFQVAAAQCDILYDKEDEPEVLLKEVIEAAADANNKAKNSSPGKTNENEALFTLLGKLKIPQRKSVEVRAELIKEIYKYSEND